MYVNCYTLWVQKNPSETERRTPLGRVTARRWLHNRRYSTENSRFLLLSLQQIDSNLPVEFVGFLLKRPQCPVTQTMLAQIRH